MALRPAEWQVTPATAVAGVVTATRAAEPGRKHYITSVTISGSGVVAATVSAQVRNTAGGVIMDQVEIPATAFPPIQLSYDSPLECPLGASADVTMPSLGAGIRGTVSMQGYTL